MKKKGLPVVFGLSCFLSFFACSGFSSLAATQEEASMPEVIQYQDLGELVTNYCPQVQMERSQYESRLDQLEAVREEMQKTRSFLKEEAGSMEEKGEDQGAEHYHSQAKGMEEAIKDLDRQIRSAKSSVSVMPLRKMEDTMLWSAQNLMGTYHNLRLEQEGARARAELKKSQYEKLLHQVSLGSATRQQAEEAQKEFQASSNRAIALADQMEQVRKEILMITGYSLSSNAQIGPMPVPEKGRVSSINLEQDKRTALGNNYTLREQRGGSFSGTNKELHARQRSIWEGEENMYAELEALYQDVAACESQWSAFLTEQEFRETAFKTASHKMELGMISRQEYLEEQCLYLEGKALEGQAGIQFQLSMDAYDWARKGLM